MNKYWSIVKKYLDPLFNTRAAGLYILLFAITIGVATFIENDFGTSSAQKVIFQAWWFELLLILFGITIVVNIFRYRMIQMKKWSLLIFHAAMIIILIGAGVTRYFGYEGVMHIRENDSSNSLLSADTYLQFEFISNGQKYRFDEPVLFATLGDNHFKESYQIGSDLVEFEVNDFVPNPKQELKESANAQAIIKLVLGGMNGREEYFIRQGESKRIRSLVYNFEDRIIPGAVNIIYRNDSLLIRSNSILQQTIMATQQRDTLYPNDGPHMLRLRSLYSDGVNNFVFDDFNTAADVQIISEDPKVRNESMTALQATLTVNGDSKTHYIFGKKGLPGRPAIYRIGNTSTAISYGAKSIELPFSIKLYDFIMERYPGTNSAASYASEVQLNDPRNGHQEDFRIYMNHILDYDGYRFFQSSFDQDELGTYLSVNHDFWGTWISYLGYGLLTLGLIMVFFSQRTRFYKVSQKVNNMNKTAVMILICSCTLMPWSTAQKVIEQQVPAIEESHAELWSQVVVQDHKGRMKPMHTLTRELLRKISRKESIAHQNADQVVLGMFAHKQNWIGVPMIKITDKERLQSILGVNGPLVAYRDFFEPGGAYKLREEVRRAYSLQPIDRTAFEKDIMKIDERVNIASMIYSGAMFRLIPIPGDLNNTWVSAQPTHGSDIVYPETAERFYKGYKQAVHDALHTGDYDLPNQILTELATYQSQAGVAIIPSPTQLSAEILLNKMNVFSRLALYYSLLGLGFLTLLFLSVFKPQLNTAKVFKWLFYFVILGFLFHTLGLGIRWYVSGRAPWSNGYETMIYIAWTTTLAGLIFTRKSKGGLAAMMILAGCILLVAMLSYLDPEITPLVPVLKSYWLTIHVSLIAGSYGFLMLGAIIGLINLIMMIFLSEQNKQMIKRLVKEMSYISEMTMLGGLVMISIGTYLGGVWANESWGRYWGWDAKETWALVTILVYAFILHMRLIPKLQGLYAFNLATLFGWASVIMTYFGVNYYLSGLHSYAAGDPVPIPTWVYITVVCVVVISVLAFLKKRKVGFE